MQEIWKDIKEYERKYQVSNLGNIRKINKDYRSPNYRILKKIKLRNGYYRVVLYKNNIRTQFTVHRLVAKTFIPNPENKPTVNHKDGNKANNCVDNLEWTTYSENQKHSIDTLHRNRNTLKQRQSAIIIGKSKRKLNLQQAYSIRKEVKIVSRKELAKKYNVSLSVIDNIVQNKRYID